MQIWVLFAAAGAGCLVIGLLVSMRQLTQNHERVIDLPTADFDDQGGPVQNPTLPPEWNEALITQQFTQLRAQRPTVMPHFLNGLLERFIMGQDERTVQKRTQFFRALCEQLKLSKELAVAIDDLKAYSKEREKRAKELELEQLKLDIESRRLTRTEELECKRDEMRIELEIAKLEQEIANTKKASSPEPKKTAQQERTEKRIFWDSEVSRLTQAKRAAVEAIPENEEDSRMRTANMYENAIENAHQQLSKYL